MMKCPHVYFIVRLFKGKAKEKEKQLITYKACLILLKMTYQKNPWLSDETLQIAEEKQVKGKGERKRHELSEEFQRRARRDTKVFSSEQCKEINRGKQ